MWARCSQKTTTCHVILTLMSLDQHFNNILTFKYYSLFVEFLCFRAFVFGYMAQNEKPISKIKYRKKKTKIAENLYFSSFHFLSYIKWVLCIHFFIFLWYVIKLLYLTVFLWFPWFPWFPSFRPGSVQDHVAVIKIMELVFRLIMLQKRQTITKW